MLVPKDIENKDRASGYNGVGSASAGPNGGGQTVLWRAQRWGTANGRRRCWKGPSRKTPKEAAQDYCDHVNGLGVAVKIHTGRSGRPDFFMLDGTLHMDLPGEGGSSRARPQRPQRAQSPERDLMLRMEPTLRSLMQNGDLGEAKAGIGRQQIVTGVGQLRLKRFENGKGRMFLVLPERPAKPICDWVTDEGISLVIEKEVTNG